MTENKVVAKIENIEIRENDVLNFVQEIGPQMAMQFQSPDGMKKIIREMVNQELLLLDAKDSGMEKEEEFQKVFETTKDNLLKSYAFSKLIGKIKISEEEIKDYFEEFKDVFTKEMIEASHILVDTDEKAKEVKKLLDEGKKFEELAKQYSTCPSNREGGYLGRFPRGQMVPEFESVAFDMGEGEISEPVKTQFGYHIIKLIKKITSEDIELSDVYDDVKMEALRVKQVKAYEERIKELEGKYKTEIL
ncbi:MAG: peptidylprolyl isomerase [Tissierellia bacterium]|nr:peptidylprolyl isomerase [Tissierellia bacterium]